MQKRAVAALLSLVLLFTAICAAAPQMASAATKAELESRIGEIDKEIADLAARNLVIVRLHTSGILNGSDYSAQSSEINNRISALRSERKKKIAEDEYELTFSLPADADSGFFVIRAK